MARAESIVSESEIIFFADDLIIFGEDEAKLERFFNVCDAWANSHGMVWAAAKCLALTRPNSVGNLHLNHEKLSRVDSALYLGMTLEFRKFSDVKIKQRINT